MFSTYTALIFPVFQVSFFFFFSIVAAVRHSRRTGLRTVRCGELRDEARFPYVRIKCFCWCDIWTNGGQFTEFTRWIIKKKNKQKKTLQCWDFPKVNVLGKLFAVSGFLTPSEQRLALFDPPIPRRHWPIRGRDVHPMLPVSVCMSAFVRTFFFWLNLLSQASCGNTPRCHLTGVTEPFPLRSKWSRKWQKQGK